MQVAKGARLVYLADDQAVLTVAIIGAGQIGQEHGRAFAELGPNVQVVGVADIDERRAIELADICSARAFTDYRVLLELSPDIVVVSLPHDLHREVGLAAASAGSHVLMEKPLAHTLEDAYAIVHGCEQHNVLLTVGFVHRYRVEFQHARRVIEDGRIGSPAMIVDIFGLPGGEQVPPWVWQRQRAGGGVLMYTGVHSIDWQRWLLGSEVEEVFAITSSQDQDIDVENTLVAILRFGNGCLGALIGNQPPYELSPSTRRTEVYGSRGRLRIRKGRYVEYSSEDQAYHLDVIRDTPLVTQAGQFVAAVREQRPAEITGDDGLRALAVAEAVYRSAELGEPVSMKGSMR